MGLIFPSFFQKWNKEKTLFYGFTPLEFIIWLGACLALGSIIIFIIFHFNLKVI